MLIPFEYSYLHDGWVHRVKDALADVVVQEAAWRPSPKVKGIWDIVLHMALWTENIVVRKWSGEPVRQEGGPWPAPPSVPDEAEWHAAQQRLWNALAALRTQTEADPPWKTCTRR